MTPSADGLPALPDSLAELSRRDFRRILIIKPSSPGDIIHALPVMRGLRRRFPNAHLAWFVATPFVNLIEADPDLNAVIKFDRKHLARIGRSWRATADFLRLIGDLRREKFDLVVDLQGLFRSGFMAWASGAKSRIGFRGSREFAWIFYTHRVPRLPADMHAVDKNLYVGRALFGEMGSADSRIAMTAADRAAADSLLTSAGIAFGDRFVVLVPGTRWETKRWPAKRFGELAMMVFELRGLKSVLVGAPSDIEDGRIAEEASRAGATTAAVNLCGRTTFRELAAIIDRAAVVVTADSAPMHIAAAHGRPLVAMFGPTNPQRTGPHGKLESVVRLDLPCSPCYLRKLSQCPFQHKCMEALSHSAVLIQVLARLDAADPQLT